MSAVNPPGHKTREGFQWTKAGGLQAELPCLGTIKPETNINSSQATYDVIVIGAGYTGLTATRDLTVSGQKVLMLEARDRIGGRTWSSNIDGYPFEMGGTWVHWNQPFVYREIARYGMQKQLQNSHDPTKGVNSYTLTSGAKRTTMSRDEEAVVMESAMRKFINVDGNYCRTLIPFPHDPHYNPDVAIYDKMSFADRLAEMGDSFTTIERISFEGFLSITSGGTMENSSFFELLRWWALNNYDMQQFMELCLTFKFRCGQSAFARRFWDEAVQTGNLNYAFSTPVASVHDMGSAVKVTTRNGRTFLAKAVVCTLPLNVLNTVSFQPALKPAQVEAATLGHANHVVKVHVECANPELRSFSGIVYPDNKLTYMFGDGTTPAGNVHLVSFGNSLEGTHLQPEENVQDTIAAAQRFAPGMDVKRAVFHNWHKDEWAQGAWEWLQPGMSTKYVYPLRETQGNVVFASADWALGWRGFIDGAIEDGARAAMELKERFTAAKSKQAAKL